MTLPYLHMTKRRPPASNGQHAWFLNAARTKERQTMKSFFWTVGGFCAAAAGLLVWGARRTPKVEDLAHKLEDAWADHHTVL
jgi:hypothetical protein